MTLPHDGPVYERDELVCPCRLERGPMANVCLMLRLPLSDELVFRFTGARTHGRAVGEVVYRLAHDLWPDTEAFIEAAVYRYVGSETVLRSPPRDG